METPAVDGPIVLATKPFDATESPLAIARWLAHREDRELHVVSVYEDEVDALAIAAGAPPLPQNYYEEERVAVAERMREELERTDAMNVTSRVDVVSGPSARVIVDTARERDARIIVIGTGRHDPMGRFLYGERAMQIVRLADRPVLIVPRDATAGTIKRAVVAVDFSRASLRAARAVLPMLSFEAELTLLHVRPAKAVTGNARSSAINARCDEMFARFIGLLPLPPGLKVSTRIVWGDTVESIDLYARSVAADIVVCGRVQTHTIAERVLVGSISAGLLRRVHCPILIAPELREDARDDARSPLTGAASWERADWSQRLLEFGYRNEGRRVRLGSELSLAEGGRCVVQNYVLRSIAVYDGGRLHLVLADRVHEGNQLVMNMDGLQSLMLQTNVAGEDTHLEFTYRDGRGTLTLDPRELP